ncbi:uncharacterized protein cubi_02823 [Cryptosporidium ubiquitum]|uniref:Uncharacterized protein n=1 Tax=Cryptosporidium ubiquitum TaxID=857276 RepID=A0A1J4MMD7_9CRYT|nr:uncharacterized protein cubi_02823 [Cryptosporidium ubiquitum]OII74021.1 hypothetical protein cubi_02823 [Cryptosporidium ubiquitum]
MKVKVILRAPKSQIPLYMTLNDAKFGNEEVTTSLNVIESNEVVRWVNDTSVKSPTNLQVAPQKQLVISEDLARSISKGISEIFNSKNKVNKINDNRVRDLKSNSNLLNIRHKYNVCHIKDAFPEKKIATELIKKNEDAVDNNIETNKDDVGGEKNPEIGKVEKLLSQDLEKVFPSSSGSMGALFGSRYNGKELKSNLRKKYFKGLNSKSNRSYEYNKKFRSNEDFPEDFHELFPKFDDSDEEKDVNINLKDNDIDLSKTTEMIQKKIQDEIDNASKMESIQNEIAKTFKNLTLNPCLCKASESFNKPYDRNQVIIQKHLSLNELRKKIPLKNGYNHASPKNNSHNMYFLIHGSGKETESAVLPKDLKSRPVSNFPNKSSYTDQGKISKSPKNANLKDEYHGLNPNFKYAHTPENNDQEIKHPQGEGENGDGHRNEGKNEDANERKSLGEGEDSGRSEVLNKFKGSDEKKSQKEDSDPKSRLFNALSRLNLELSNTNSALEQCLKEEDLVSSIDEVFIKGLQEKLENLELLYKRMQINFNQDNPLQDLNQIDNQSKYFHLNDDQNNQYNDNEAKMFLNEDNNNNNNNGIETASMINSNKVPNTNLPLLTDIPSQKKDGTNLVMRKLPIQKIVHSQNKSPTFQTLNKIDSKRSVSVPAHEKQLSNLYCEKSTNSLGEIPSLNKPQENSRNKSLISIGSFSSVNSNHSITSKSPLSKVGLKPNSSSEKLSFYSEEESRGRTRPKDYSHPRTYTRDFVAENKSNVVLNASKSSSSLLQNNQNKKSTKLQKKKPSIEKTYQNSFNNDNNSGKINSVNHNQQQLQQDGINHFSSTDEIYPSLEVGGPIARMNRACGGFVPCFPGSYLNTNYDPNLGNFPGNHYNRSNYHHINNYSQFPQYQQPNFQRMNSYIGTNNFVDNNTPRCPYWCNLICRI